MSPTMYIFCAVAAVLLAPSSNCHCKFKPAGDACVVDSCLSEGIQDLSNCIAKGVHSLKDNQKIIKRKLECVNRGGMECAVDDMCYRVAVERNFKNAQEYCTSIEGGAMISELPSSPEVIEKCLKLKVGDMAWLDEMPTDGMCQASEVMDGFIGGPSVNGTCTEKDSKMVCKIIIPE